MTMSWYPDLSHVQALGDGGPRSTTQMVVIHATDNTAPASGEAAYATHRADETSAHFYVDDGSVWQALDTTHEAYGCYPIGNSRSVQLELCGLSNHLSDAAMRRAAPIVARVCREFGIPIRKVSPTDLRNGVRGICGHADVTAAWGQGDHTDPGTAFPWDRFIEYVQGDDMSQQSDEILAAWSVGVDHYTAPDGSQQSVEPVKWRVRDEAFQAGVNKALADLAAKVAAAPAVGQPSQDQVDAAVAKALGDPSIQAGIGAAIAAHLKVV